MKALRRVEKIWNEGIMSSAGGPGVTSLFMMGYTSVCLKKRSTEKKKKKDQLFSEINKSLNSMEEKFQKKSVINVFCIKIVLETKYTSLTGDALENMSEDLAYSTNSAS